MNCPHCGETDNELFYLKTCRRCLGFQYQDDFQVLSDVEPLNLGIKLTPHQKEISDQLCKYGMNESVFIDAVCGAGKTEICLEFIYQCFKQGLRVCWAIPRREVVLELASRLQGYFVSMMVKPVCQGFTKDFAADLIVCTTHQLFRFPKYFDVIILDEPDAFPYANNPYLERLVFQATKGSIIYLSATFDIQNVRRLTLPMRPSYKLLPVPRIVVTRIMILRFLMIFRNYRNEHCLIFVPTKRMAHTLSRWFRIPFITSSTLDKDQKIKEFKASRGILISTTVLERGVTFIDCHVFVLFADHRVFQESSLIQISGRAMRGMNPQKGDVWFLCHELSKPIEAAITRIKKANRDALYVLNL